MNNSCIFCQIVKGEAPATKIYEDEKVLAFLNIKPNNYGQALLIPKEHYPNYFETPDDVLKNLATECKKIGIAIKKATGADGMNIIINSEKAAGQVIFHIHIHIIPRFFSDGYKHWEPKPDQSETEREKIAEKIRENLK